MKSYAMASLPLSEAIAASFTIPKVSPVFPLRPKSVVFSPNHDRIIRCHSLGFKPGNKEKPSQITGSMYAHGSPYRRGFLKVSDIHTIYYELYGNPEGRPAVFLHGGPGAGCAPRHAGFFDPQSYNIILFDQRGCGKSTPRGCLKQNTTWDLVEDLEKLRKHLLVNKWLVMGGSWGVTLALAYGQAHPDAVFAFILRGVCMLRQEEIDWFYKQGANSLFPFAWDNLLSILDPSEREDVIHSFYKRLTSNDVEVQLQAARAWLRWEMGLSFFSVDETIYAWDGNHYSLHSLQEDGKVKGEVSASSKRQGVVGVDNKQPQLVKSQPSVTPEERKDMTPQVAQARLECHYFLNAGFLKENKLLDGVQKICHIPCAIVHGRYDFVCPVKVSTNLLFRTQNEPFNIAFPGGYLHYCLAFDSYLHDLYMSFFQNAFDLHQAWPQAELYIVCNAGHSMYEKGITQQLLSATRRFKSIS